MSIAGQSATADAYALERRATNTLALPLIRIRTVRY